VGTRGPFSGAKVRPGHDADHSPPSSAKVKNEQELYILSSQAPPRLVAGQLSEQVIEEMVNYFELSSSKYSPNLIRSSFHLAGRFNMEMLFPDT
jgi:hypothetical protein